MTGSTGRSQSSRSALAEAYEKAVKSEAEKKARNQAVEEKRTRTRVTLLAIGWILIAGCGLTLWLRPEWFGLGVVAETTNERDANVRLTLYVAGLQLQQYKAKHGSYPERLDDAGKFVSGLAYTRTPEGGYILKLTRGPDRITLTSSDSLSTFLGPSLSRLVQQRAVK